ncbi:MAG TPA: Hsp20/alpha crystallin family protein [Pyrinomonadaceae bacterium]|nr:Hsp20/alpha crystallin family protein [Pyrinomonadaceae bacterium]
MAQWNPLHDLVTLQDRMNRLFEDATQRRAAESETGDQLESADWYPAADVFEQEDTYLVALDLPGIDRAQLDISLDDDRLTIKGERPARQATQHRRECPTGRFVRTFSIPAAVEQAGIRASYKDGVLQVSLPKQTQPKTTRVQIQVS